MAELSSSPAPRPSRLRAGLIAGIALALALVAYGLTTRHAALTALQARSDRSAVLTVATTRPVGGSADEVLRLPASLEAPNEASLYARSQGYVRRLHADIGQQVKAGQLLAEIDTPELDEQLRQVEADVATSRANEELSRTTAERWQQLLEQKLVARQAAEEKFADARAKRAALDSQTANLARLRQLQGFRRIVAPFAGTITARTVDVGQLVTAAGSVSGQAAGVGSGALFRIASGGALRVFVLVPQSQAAAIRPGQKAQLLLPEQAGAAYVARVVRSAGAIDPQSRALRVELVVEDAGAALLPGAYAQVGFTVPASTTALRLPVSTLIFRGKGPMVAVMTPDNRVDLRPVQLGRDFGTEYEVATGVAANDEVIVNPPDSLRAGQAVQRVSAHP